MIGARRQILLVEDNPGDAGLVREYLTRAPQHDDVITHVETLAAARQCLRHGAVDAVLLDLHLPDCSGLDCVRALRELAPDLPIIALTGGGDDDLALRCIAAGAQDYVPKHELGATNLHRAVAHAMARVREAAQRERADALQQRLAAIVEASRDAIVSCTLDGRITSWNQGAEQIFGYRGDQAIGRPVRELIRGVEAGAGAEQDRRIFQPRHDSSASGAEEVVRLRRDGRPVTLSVVTSVVPDGAGGVSAIAAIFRDVTEARRRDDELRRLLAAQGERERRMRALTARLNTLREEERTRISREVHDGLGQLLTGLKMNLRWMARRLAAGTPVAALQERLAETETLVDQTVTSVQRIAVELRPSALDALGLPAAIRDEVRRFEARSGIETTVQIDDVAPVEPAVATALFRILQELLTNVARHAQARSLCVALADEDGARVMRVSDDGVGLPPQALAGGGSLGVLGMTERAAAVGGTLSLDARACGGTLATVRVPASAAAAAAAG